MINTVDNYDLNVMIYIYKILNHTYEMTRKD